jgi:acyl carrier protein
MSEMNIQERFMNVIRTVFENDSIEWNPELTAEDVDGWDSITHLDLIVATEEEFEIEISGFDVMGLKNIGDLVQLITKKLN